MLLAAKEDIIARYIILFLTMFLSLIMFFSKIKNFIKTILIMISLLLERSF